ncbi:MAG: hypothetical protein IJ291_01205 [Lachnospiraceae bacterium]|nr:hypothetical protein [Lachnospiraceae bacterium]
MQVLILGGDLRQVYLAEKLREKGFQVSHYKDKEEVGEEALRKRIKTSPLLILPIPVTGDGTHLKGGGESRFLLDEIKESVTSGTKVFAGVFPKEFRRCLEENGVECLDFMEMEEVALYNGIATAEGAVAEAVKLSHYNLHGKSCLVAGYGRCGKILADKLKGLNARVTIMARKPEVRALAEALGYETADFTVKPGEEYRFIFNTVPEPVFGENRLERVSRDCVIIDIAGAPGGTDFSYCEKHGIKAKLCSGLPGIYSPASSGEILADAFLKIVKPE